MKKWLTWCLGIGAGILVLIVGFVVDLRWFQPAFYFPKPTGQYAVGYHDYHWVDSSRAEPRNSDPAHPHREIMVRLWYPAFGTLPARAAEPWQSDLVTYFKRNASMLWRLGLSRPVYAYARLNAPISRYALRFPLIIFSHGATGTCESNTAHCEALASSGYVVAGISHPYDSRLVRFPDGRMIEERKSSNEKPKNFLERRASIEQELEVRVADARFVIDQLENMAVDEASPFYQRFDVHHIGIFGQSMGGSTAVAVCRRDKRVTAGVDMDGSLFGVDAIQPIGKPFMFLLAGNSVALFEGSSMKPEHWQKFGITSPAEEAMVRERYVASMQRLVRLLGRDGYLAVVPGAGHNDFTDVALFKNASLITRLVVKYAQTSKFGVGAIDGRTVTAAVNTYLVSFFDTYLKRKPLRMS